MKAITICAVLLAIGASYIFMTTSKSANSVEEQYQLYLAEYGKTIFNSDEYKFRLSVFEENLKAIERINSQQSSFKVGINQFADVIPENVEYTPSKDNLSYYHHDGPMEAFIDWREKGAVHKKVEDQRSCRSGWAFSATSAFEASYFLMRKNSTLVKFAEQQLVDCSYTHGNHGCNGGWMTSAFQYLRNTPFCSSSDYPYEARENRCRSNTCGIRDARVSRVDKVFPNSYANLKAALNAGPVAVAIETRSKEFMLYKEGVLDTFECGTRLDHGALAIGYGSENRTEYFLVKNSWGEKWGENGYIKIAANPRYELYGGICGIMLDATVPYA